MTVVNDSNVRRDLTFTFIEAVAKGHPELKAVADRGNCLEVTIQPPGQTEPSRHELRIISIEQIPRYASRFDHIKP